MLRLLLELVIDSLMIHLGDVLRLETHGQLLLRLRIGWDWHGLSIAGI